METVITITRGYCGSKEPLYTVAVDGVHVLECLTADEVATLTVNQITELRSRMEK